MSNREFDPAATQNYAVVDRLRANKEPIAQLSDAAIGRTKLVRRDPEGFDVVETIPSRMSKKYLDRHGNEVFVALQNHRVTTRKSFEVYGRQHHESVIRDGFLPKDECPHTHRYADMVGGPLVEPPPGVQACQPTAEQSEGPNWHGCPHYIAVRDARRAKSKKDTRRRKAERQPNKAMAKLLELELERKTKEADDAEAFKRKAKPRDADPG